MLYKLNKYFSTHMNALNTHTSPHYVYDPLIPSQNSPMTYCDFALILPEPLIGVQALGEVFCPHTSRVRYQKRSDLLHANIHLHYNT